MTEERRAAPLVFGILLLVLGVFFLGVNLQKIEVEWLSVWKFAIPLLFLTAGLTKLVRHFVWDEDRLSKHPRRAGLLSGIFWTSVGALIVLDLLDYVEGLDFFGRYWPLLLIVFGFGKIIDFYRLQGRLQFRVGEVVGVILIALIGFASGKAAQAHFPLINLHLPLIVADREFPLRGLVGTRYRWVVEERVAAQGLSGIEINNLYGDVQVEGGAGDQVEIRLTKAVAHSSEEKAREIADEIVLSPIAQDGTLIVRTNREALADKEYNFNTHFVVRVPEQLKVRVVNGYGDLRVTRVSAPCELENSFGKVVADFIGGNLRVVNKYRAVEARNVKGNVLIVNRRGLVYLEEITGNVDAGTDYDSLVAERIRGHVSLRNHFGRVRLEKVREGNCSVEAPGSSVEVSDVEKNVEVRNSHRNVTVKNVAAAVRVDTSYSRLNVTAVEGPLLIRASHATIYGQELTAGITVQGLGSSVSLSSLAGPVHIATSLRGITLTGFKGPVEVQNEYGPIEMIAREPLEGKIVANNKNGRIVLALPSDTSFKLYAQATAGKIYSDFGPQKAPSQEGSQVLEMSFGAGKPEVRLQTSYSEIRIQDEGTGKSTTSGGKTRERD